MAYKCTMGIRPMRNSDENELLVHARCCVFLTFVTFVTHIRQNEYYRTSFKAYRCFIPPRSLSLRVISVLQSLGDSALLAIARHCLHYAII